MKKLTLLPFLFFIALSTFAQEVKRPKLVVGIVVDQMRWDFLYRYHGRYGKGGFKRLLNEGFSCENTLINHLPSVTGIGHATVYTGSVPAIHGIAGNEWIDNQTGKSVYCTDDSTVQGVGSNNKAGKMSPKNLLATTITDELRIATNFRSKVVGVSLKDRASILPAGHNPTAAFWFDDASGNFITSTWYMKDLPQWVKTFNDVKEPEKLLAKDWNTLYPINTYHESSVDDNGWEGKFAGEKTTSFPHSVGALYKEDHDVIRSTPFGNTLTLDFAKAAIDGYNMGAGSVTDFLAINCASTDYAGHMFGPNSIEVEDVYLRLDKDLETFFNYLDKKVGKENYLVFLSADHGAAHSIGFMKEHKMPAEFFVGKDIIKKLNDELQKEFGQKGIVFSGGNYQIHFNHSIINNNKLDYDAVKKATIRFLRMQDGVQFVSDVENIGAESIPQPVKEMIINGYNPKRSGPIQVVLDPAWFDGKSRGTGTTHGTWGPHDTHIPLIFMGWNIPHGTTNHVTNMTDIAPTLAALLKIQMPNGNIGKPITPLTDKIK